MDAVTIYNAAKEHPEFCADLESLAKKAFPSTDNVVAMVLTAEGLIRYEQMWHEAGNAWPYCQNREFHGWPTLYLGQPQPSHTKQLNPDLTASTYLKVAHEFLCRWAFKENTGDSLKDWDIAQTGFAEIIMERLKTLYSSVLH